MSKSIYANTAKGMNPATPSSVTQPIIGREADMIKNDGGGYSFKIDKWSRLNRFLIIGSEGGTYYVNEQKLTLDNAKNVLSCIKENAKRVVDLVVEISHEGRAMKNEPALFILALVVANADAEGRKYALENLSKVARIGTHLFTFVEFVNNLRGWGRGLRNAISKWYVNRDVASLAMQLTKYQSRNGWSHRDVLRLTHVKPADESQNLAFRWSTGKLQDNDMDKIHANEKLAFISNFEKIKSTNDEKTIIDIVKNGNIPLELIPTEKRSDKVLEAALPNLGITALIRNLGMYSSKGMLDNYSEMSKYVISKILDADTLKNGRIHPMFVLNAMYTYASGHGMKGSLAWGVNQNIVNALDEAYYMSFKYVEPTNKNIFLGLDVSGSMYMARIMGMNLSAGQVAGAMAMTTIRTEKSEPWVYGFGSTLKQIGLNKKMRLDAVLNEMRNISFGATNPGLVFEHAIKNNLKVDAFIIITDNDCNSGGHAQQLLEKYRQKSGIASRFIVVATTGTWASIADPTDKYSIDISGFDTSTPKFISDFIVNG